ncbi:MAG: hypothetical protein IPP47_22710 [Bryobacterales bacterium]|nr:hypothetical protein [Bryobacterales bacterium]
MEAIEAAAHVGPAEGADEALIDAVALEGGEGGVLWRGLGAVHPFKAAQADALIGVAEEALEADVGLLGEDHRGVGVVLVGGVVVAAEAKLGLRRGRDGGGGHAEQDGGGELDLPVDPLQRLGEAELEDIAGVGVAAVGVALEVIPHLQARSEAAGDGDGAELEQRRGGGRR